MFGGHLGRHMHRPLELAYRLDDVISGRDDHDGRRITTDDEGRTQADAGSGVPAARFAHDVIGRQLGQLPARLGLIRLPSDDPGVLGRQEHFDAVHRLLQQRALAAQRQKLFRPLLPAARPKPRTATTRHDHRVKHSLALSKQVPTLLRSVANRNTWVR